MENLVSIALDFILWAALIFAVIVIFFFVFAVWRQILWSILFLIIFGVGWYCIGLKWMLGILYSLIALAVIVDVIQRSRKSKTGNIVIQEKRKRLGYDE